MIRYIAFVVILFALSSLCHAQVAAPWLATPTSTVEASIGGYEVRGNYFVDKGSVFSIKATGGPLTEAYAKAYVNQVVARDEADHARAVAIAAAGCAPARPTYSCYGMGTVGTSRSCCGTRSPAVSAYAYSRVLYTSVPPAGRAFWCDCPLHRQRCAALGYPNWHQIPCQCGTGCPNCAMCGR